VRYRIRGLEYYNAVMKSTRRDYLEADLNLMKLLYDEAVAERLFEVIDQKLMPKILEDISYILEKKWARGIPRCASGEVSHKTEGFYHCHLLGEPGLKISGKPDCLEADLERVVSPTNVSILYHTREFMGEEYKKPEHNVLSSLNSEPHTVDPRQFQGKERAVNFADLGKTHYVQIDFYAQGMLRRIQQTILRIKPEYRLKNGIQLRVEAVLLFGLINKEESHRCERIKVR
jgi:hypothetical protein